MRIDELTNVLEGYPKILAIDINDNTSTMNFRLLDAITGGLLYYINIIQKRIIM